MPILLSENLKAQLRNKYIFLDNDFLSLLFRDDRAFTDSLDLLSNSSIIIDQFTEFEFLRDIFQPKDRILREQFLSHDVFVPAISHQERHKTILKNALLLSKIYVHQHSKSKKSPRPSSIDLLLAGRLMFHRDNSLLITGNKKDFPSCVFELAGVISHEDVETSSIRPYSLIKFSPEKFKTAYADYKKMNKKGLERFEKELAIEEKLG